MKKPLLFTLLTVLVCLAPALAGADDQARPSLSVAMQAFRPTLDPAIALANVGFPLSIQMFDTLIYRDMSTNQEGTGNVLKPGLARSWERLDDLTLELKLRPGLTFHNGEPLTAEDVRFSFERILAPDSKYTWAKTQLSNIDRVEVKDDLTVRVVTKKPDAVLINLLAYMATAIVPKDYFQKVGFEAFGQKPVGSGPYRLVKYRAKELVEFEPFDQWYGGRPPLAKLTIKVIPEVSARITALANNEVQIINSIPPDQLSAVEKLESCRILSTPVNHHLINYRTAHPAMADKKLRQALNLAIDRRLLADTLWGGRATVSHGHQYPEWGQLYNPDRPRFAYDPDKAKKLLKESGYQGQELIFTTHPVYYTNGLAAAQAVTEMWRRIGARIKLKVDENWYANSLKDESIAIRNISDWLVIADPHVTILWSWAVSSQWTDNDRFKELGQEAMSTLETGKRLEIYQQMLDMFEEEAPGTVLYRAQEFYGVKKNLDWRPYMYFMEFRPGHIKIN